MNNVIVCILDMGNNDSKQNSVEQNSNFLSRFIDDFIAQPSEFYYACQMGNVDRVRELLPTVAYNKKVCTPEPNGDMALHAVVRAGHAYIVALLLANGFSRIAINKENKTAYEIAPNDEIRSLFHRPISELQARFTDKDVNETLNILDLNEDTDNQAVYNSLEEAIQSRYMARFNRRPKLLRNIVKTMTEARSMETFEKLVREFQSLCDIKTGDQILLKNSFEEFLQTKNINKLIHLYTLNDLYKTIREHVSAYTTLVYLNVSS
jgi:ankyrin repeat protein